MLLPTTGYALKLFYRGRGCHGKEISPMRSAKEYLATTIAIRLAVAVFPLLAAFAGSETAHAAVEDLRITEVDPTGDGVEVTNPSTDPYTAPNDLPLCHLLDCTSFIPMGTVFAPGDSIVFTVTGLDDAAGDIWLYRDGADFTDPGRILTGIQYGAAVGSGRTPVAVAAGIWPDTGWFVPLPSPPNTLQLTEGIDATDPANWTGRAPTPGAFIGTGAEILDPLPDIAKGSIMIELEPVADGLVSPLGVVEPPDGSSRLLIYDQAGFVRIVDDGSLQPQPFLDVSARLVSLQAGYDERGLLGFALHPDFASNGLVYTYTSEPVSGTIPSDFTVPISGSFNHQSIVAEWQVLSTDPNLIDLSSRREILRIDEPQSNHNGGALRFGPDSFLYIVLGDGGAADDEGEGHGTDGNGQNPDTVLGTVLRIDVDGSNSANGRYGVPASNPFVGSDGVDEIFAYGFRNPFAFSFDAVTGILHLGDVGQGDVEEIDVVVPGGNYGWHVKEGSFFFDPNGGGSGFVTTLPTVPVPPGLINPIAEYDHDEGSAVIGGFVYRGSRIPALRGRYVFGDFDDFSRSTGRLFCLDDWGNPVEFIIGGDDRPLGFTLKGIGEDLDRELYVCVSGNLGPSGTAGKVFRIVGLASTSVEARTWSEYR